MLITLYIMLITLYIMLITLYIMLITLYIMLITLYIMLITLYNAHNPIYNAYNPIYNAHNPIYNADNPIYNAHNPIYNADNPIYNADNPIYNAHNPIYNADIMLLFPLFSFVTGVSHFFTSIGLSKKSESISMPKVIRIIFMCCYFYHSTSTYPLIQMNACVARRLSYSHVLNWVSQWHCGLVSQWRYSINHYHKDADSSCCPLS